MARRKTKACGKCALVLLRYVVHDPPQRLCSSNAAFYSDFTNAQRKHPFDRAKGLGYPLNFDAVPEGHPHFPWAAMVDTKKRAELEANPASSADSADARALPSDYQPFPTPAPQPHLPPSAPVTAPADTPAPSSCPPPCQTPGLKPDEPSCSIAPSPANRPLCCAPVCSSSHTTASQPPPMSDAMTLDEVVAFEGHSAQKAVWRTDFLPGSNQVVTACADHVVRIFDSDTGAARPSLTAHKSSVRSLSAICATAIATGDSSGVLCIWRAASGDLLFHDDLRNGTVWAICATSPTAFVVGTAAGRLMLYEHADGARVRCVRVMADEEEEAAILAVFVRGDRLVTALDDGWVIVRDAGTWEELAVLPVDSHIERPKSTKDTPVAVIGVAMDERYIVTATGSFTKAGCLIGMGGVVIWDAQTFGFLYKMESVRIQNVLANILILGEFLLTASASTLELTVIATQRPAGRIALPFEVRDVAIADDGRIAVCGREGTACIFPFPFFPSGTDSSADERLTIPPVPPESAIPSYILPAAVFQQIDSEPSRSAPSPPNSSRAGPSSSLPRRSPLAPSYYECSLTSSSDNESCDSSRFAPPLRKRYKSIAAPSAKMTTTTSGPVDCGRRYVLPDFTLLRTGGVSDRVLEPMGCGEISDLLACYLVGFQSDETELFGRLRKSILRALRKAGVLAGHFLTGADPVLKSSDFVQCLREQLQADDCFFGSTDALLLRFVNCLGISDN